MTSVKDRFPAGQISGIDGGVHIPKYPATNRLLAELIRILSSRSPFRARPMARIQYTLHDNGLTSRKVCTSLSGQYFRVAFTLSSLIGLFALLVSMHLSSHFACSKRQAKPLGPSGRRKGRTQSGILSVQRGEVGQTGKGRFRETPTAAG